MSRREDIDNSIWQDETFDSLSVDAAFLYLWSFTNPRCGMAGIYRVAARQLAEGRLSAKRVEDALAELQRTRLAYYADGVLWVRSRAKYLRTKGEPMIRSVEKDLALIPTDHPLLAAFVAEYQDSWISEALPGVPEGVAGGSEGVLENPITKPDLGTPPEPLQGFQGKGKGSGKGKGDVEPQPPKVGTTVASEGEWTLAGDCLEAFNDAAGTRFTLPTHGPTIVRRIREHPDLGAEDHRTIVTATFRKPWWTDAPTPAVIYGNPRVFEAAVNRPRSAPQGQDERPEVKAWKERQAARWAEASREAEERLASA